MCKKFKNSKGLAEYNGDYSSSEDTGFMSISNGNDL